MQQYRMYGFVPNYLSEFYKGLYFTQAIHEFDKAYQNTPIHADFMQWVQNNGQSIIFANENITKITSVILPQLKKFNIPYFAHKNAELNDTITALVFLIPSNIYDFPKHLEQFMFDGIEYMSNHIAQKDVDFYRIAQWLKSFQPTYSI